MLLFLVLEITNITKLSFILFTQTFIERKMSNNKATIGPPTTGNIKCFRTTHTYIHICIYVHVRVCMQAHKYFLPQIKQRKDACGRVC